MSMMSCSFNTRPQTCMMPATLDSRVKALAKKYFFIISGGESSYGDDSLQMQTLNTVKKSQTKALSAEREPGFKAIKLLK